MDLNGLLGKTVYVMRLGRKLPGTIDPHEQHALRLAGVIWKVTEVDRSKGLLVVRSCAHWNIKSVCAVDVFVRYLREGYIEVE